MVSQAARVLQNTLETANESRNDDDDVFVLKMKTSHDHKRWNY
jgi:hypothetical protein